MRHKDFASPPIRAFRAFLLLGLFVHPAPGQGFYLGAAIGARGYDNACEPAALACERRDSAWSAFAGYRFNHRFDIEAAYLDLGESRTTYPRLTSTLEVSGDIDGYDLSALFRMP